MTIALPAFSCIFLHFSLRNSYYCKLNTLKQLMLKFIPAFAWACLVAVLCLIPQSCFYTPGFLHTLPLDKVVHFGMFFILSILSLRGIQIKLPLFNFWFFMLISILIMYGGLTELAQGWFTKTRHTDLIDFLTDVVGILFGFLFYLLVMRKKLSRKELVKY